MLAESVASHACPASEPSECSSEPEEQRIVEDDDIVLLTTVDIRPGVSRVLQLRQGDSPSSVAACFVQQNSLPEAVLRPLTEHLRQHLNLAEQDAAQCALAPGTETSASTSPEHHEEPDIGSEDHSACLHHSSHHQLRTAAPTQAGTQADSVFDRLYQQANTLRARAQQRVEHAREAERLAVSGRQQSHKAASTSARHRANADFANYGEYLYIEGLSELEKKRRKSAVIAEQKQQAEAAGFSFQPSISEKSRRMRANVSAPAWLRLSKHQSKFREERTLAIHSQNAEEAELAECTFKPQIDEHSKAMMQPRMRILQQHNILPHEQLFQDSMRRQARQEEYKTLCPDDVTFQPQLVSRPGSRAALQHHSARGCRDTPVTSSFTVLPTHSGEPAHYERLHAYHRKRDERMQAAQQRQMTDPRTGDYLYAQRHDANERQRALEERERLEAQQQRATPRISERSKQVLQKLKIERFCQIFAHLDDGDAGTVDVLDVVLGGSPRFAELSAEIRADLEAAAVLHCRDWGMLQEAVTPALLQSMSNRCRALMAVHAARGAQPHQNAAQGCIDGQQYATTLVDAQHFLQLMDAVVRQLHYPRRYLLPESRLRDMVETHTFRPTINAHSAELVQARRQLEDGPVHDKLHDQHKTVKARKEQRQRLKELEELAGCTFQPNLVSHQLAPAGKALAMSRSMPATQAKAAERHLFDGSGQPLAVERLHEAASLGRGGKVQARKQRRSGTNAAANSLLELATKAEGTQTAHKTDNLQHVFEASLLGAGCA